MNIVIISGELVNNAIVRGKDKKVLVFTVATKNENDDSEAMVSYAPCIVFNPPAELEQMLTARGKGLAVELQGRINIGRFDEKSEPRANGEVVVYTKSLRVNKPAA
jgi:single-stranded DNA-binding protein